MSADETETPLLQVMNLKVHFPVREGLAFKRTVGTVRAVDGVSFSVGRGETLGLVGESGSGKTTLGRAVVQLYRPTEGKVLLNGTDLAPLSAHQLVEARRRMQMVFQDPYSSLNPRQTVGATVAEPLVIHRVGSPETRRRSVADLLALVGLRAEDASKYPNQFSGGQRQRIGIARALALRPDIIIADEPVSALDVSIQAQIINLLQRLRGEYGLALIFVAHDLAVVRHVSDRIAVMYLGVIVEMAGTEDLFEAPLHPYTVALLSADPVPDPAIEARRSRIVLTGDIPSPASPPSGCRFHTRCWLREQLGRPERCEQEIPGLMDVSPGHAVACHFAEEKTTLASAAEGVRQ
ncbi:MAG TPA: oligopeptide/dipeptide ABC transporter ATP-binding protein [Streptosporangiaceae bacterium]|nr:oligopeptide/dipeptide ABC transporter ATP-binding protein [Streptosporangiaceae bacterium]